MYLLKCQNNNYTLCLPADAVHITHNRRCIMMFSEYQHLNKSFSIAETNFPRTVIAALSRDTSSRISTHGSITSNTLCHGAKD
jgi:hypothetical protein